jgi:twinkle protein
MTLAAVTPVARTGLSEQHAKWLEDRGIPCEIAAEAGLQSRGNQLLIPYSTNGTERFVKIRAPNKKFWIEPSGVPLALWNLDSLSGQSSDTLIITEGEFDALAWMAAGAPAVVSVPNGACGRVSDDDVIDPLNDTRFAYLWDKNGDLIPELRDFERIVLSLDGDEPGQLLRLELAVRLGKYRCEYLIYPEGCKDANDVLVKHGIGGLANLLDEAESIVPRRLVPFSKIPKDNRESYPAGWHGLDKHLKIRPPELMVITGSPGSGKSQFALNIGANLARLYGQRGAILQFEDHPERNHEDLLRYARAWKTVAAGGKAIEGEPEAWVDAMFRAVSPFEGEDPNESYTLDWLTTTMREAARMHNCKWVIVDPWNEIEHLWGAHENEVAYTNKALAQLKALARLLQITVIVVTHPSKGGGMKNDIREMTLYDVSGSSAFKNKADHGIVIMRPNPESNRVYIKVDKSKDHKRMGVPGTVTMTFDSRYSVYTFVGHGVIDEELNKEH